MKLLSVGLPRREVQHDALLVSPDIEIAGDKLRSLIDTDGLGVASGLGGDTIRGHGELYVERRRSAVVGQVPISEQDAHICPNNC